MDENEGTPYKRLLEDQETELEPVLAESESEEESDGSPMFERNEELYDMLKEHVLPSQWIVARDAVWILLPFIYTIFRSYRPTVTSPHAYFDGCQENAYTELLPMSQCISCQMGSPNDTTLAGNAIELHYDTSTINSVLFVFIACSILTIEMQVITIHKQRRRFLVLLSHGVYTSRFRRYAVLFMISIAVYVLGDVAYTLLFNSIASFNGFGLGPGGQCHPNDPFEATTLQAYFRDTNPTRPPSGLFISSFQGMSDVLSLLFAYGAILPVIWGLCKDPYNQLEARQLIKRKRVHLLTGILFKADFTRVNKEFKTFWKKKFGKRGHGFRFITLTERYPTEAATVLKVLSFRLWVDDRSAGHAYAPIDVRYCAQMGVE